MKQEKTGFIYIWFDKKRKMYYIGCHLGKEDDGYICSSNRMRKSYRRRPNDFKRRIIKRNIERNILLEEEYKWLQLIADSELGVKYYNLRKHHFGHWSKDTDRKMSIGEKISKSHKNDPNWGQWSKNKKMSDETKEKLRQKAIQQFSDPKNREKVGIKNIGNSYRKGKKASDETLRKMSEARKKQIPWNKGMKGVKKHSEETKQKMMGPRGPQKNPRKRG